MTRVCEACTMVLPTDVHAMAHLITHGRGHEARWVHLDEQRRLIAEPGLQLSPESDSL